MKTNDINIRNQFPILSQYAWLMNSGRTPLPLIVRSALDDIQQLLSSDVALALIVMEDKAQKARKNIAEIIGAQPNDIAFFGSATEAINVIAHSIPFKYGGNIVIPRPEFPGLVYPWIPLQEKGVEIRYVNYDSNDTNFTEKIVDAIDVNTQAVVSSHVNWNSGFKLNLNQIGNYCWDKNIYFVVDASQSMGVLNINVKTARISALVSRTDKWMLAPSGISCLYINNEYHNKLKPGLMGYFGIEEIESKAAKLEFDYPVNLKGSARRFELGSPNDIGLVGLEASTSWILKIGIIKIEERVRNLISQLVYGLNNKGYKLFSPQNENEQSAIVAFFVSNYFEIEKRILNAGVITGGSEVLSIIRPSPHFFNDESDINLLLESLP